MSNSPRRKEHRDRLGPLGAPSEPSADDQPRRLPEDDPHRPSKTGPHEGSHALDEGEADWTHPAPLAQQAHGAEHAGVPRSRVPPSVAEEPQTLPPQPAPLDRLRVFLEGALIVMLVVTVLSMAFLSFYAFVPAVILLALLAATIAVKVLGDRAERPGVRADAGERFGGQTPEPLDEPYETETVYSAREEDGPSIPRSPERAGRRVLWFVAGGLALMALVAGGVVFGYDYWGVGVLLYLGLGLLFGISVWLAMANIRTSDEAEHELQRGRRRRSLRGGGRHEVRVRRPRSDLSGGAAKRREEERAGR